MKTKNELERSNSRKKRGIREMLIFYVVLFFVIVVLALWLFQSLLLDDFYRAVKERDLRVAYTAVESMGAGVQDENAARLIGERYGVCICVYDMSREGGAYTVLSTHTLSHCALHSTDERSKFVIYEEAKARGGGFFQYFVYDSDKGIFSGISEDKAGQDEELTAIYAGVSRNSEGGDRLIILNSIITPVSATVRTIYVQLAVFTALFVVMAVVFAWVISKKFTAPIEELTESAKRFASGEREIGFSAGGYREIETLSETLGYAADEMEKTEALRRELIANISHDLRTPLTMIIGYGEMMRDLPGENTPENAGNIVAEAERLNLLVTALMELSELQAGTVELKRERFSLSEQVREFVSGFGEMLCHEGYEITFECEKDAVILADITLVGRVIQNLLTNAIQHTGEDKRVHVRLFVRDGWVTVAISDSGQGIEPERLSDIWERYYKINSAHRRGKGTGLGLSIVKAAVEQLGGHYGVESTPAVGSTFWFALPLED